MGRNCSLSDVFPKWGERESCHLEMLAAKRNADNGDAEQKAKTEVREANPESADAYPDDIHQERKASAAIAAVCHRPPEGPKCQDA